MKIGVFYFGCKVNQYDLSRVSSALEKTGLDVMVNEIGDINIVAGCVVTHKAEREGIKLLKKIRRERPNSHIFLMGCLAVHRGKELMENGIINDYFFTTDDDIGRLVNLLSDITGVTITLPSKVDLLEHSRAFLKVQDGCTYRCTFCLSRKTRISVVSYDLDSKVEEIRKIFLEGIAEVVITGINLMLWTDGIRDISYLLLKLADEAYKFGGRIRISSIYPDQKMFGLNDLWNHPGVANHLHLSVQSGSPRVLKSMNRTNYIPLLNDYLTYVRELDTGFGLSGDFIVGFPTEDEGDFLMTVDFVKRHQFNKLHVFPFSAREGTEAATLKPLPSSVLRERSRILREIGEELKITFAERLNGSVRPAVYLSGKSGRVLFDNYLYMSYASSFSGIRDLQVIASQIL